MNPVVHFELPAKDSKRMSDFYTKAFGWKTQHLGEEMGNYVLATTTEMGEDGFPKRPGAINGGLYQRTDDPATHHPSVVIAVDDIKSHLKKVTDAGGTVTSEPMDIPGVGSFATFVDTEGNRLSMLQPIMDPKFKAQ
jgi:uncharacterized protein